MRQLISLGPLGKLFFAGETQCGFTNGGFHFSGSRIRLLMAATDLVKIATWLNMTDNEIEFLMCARSQSLYTEKTLLLYQPLFFPQMNSVFGTNRGDIDSFTQFINRLTPEEKENAIVWAHSHPKSNIELQWSHKDLTTIYERKGGFKISIIFVMPVPQLILYRCRFDLYEPFHICQDFLPIFIEPLKPSEKDVGWDQIIQEAKEVFTQNYQDVPLPAIRGLDDEEWWSDWWDD